MTLMPVLRGEATTRYTFNQVTQFRKLSQLLVKNHLRVDQLGITKMEHHGLGQEAKSVVFDGYLLIQKKRSSRKFADLLLLPIILSKSLQNFAETHYFQQNWFHQNFAECRDTLGKRLTEANLTVYCYISIHVYLVLLLHVEFLPVCPLIVT
jgi:hypothetical protein